jgi:hypothetical protein
MDLLDRVKKEEHRNRLKKGILKIISFSLLSIPTTQKTTIETMIDIKVTNTKLQTLEGITFTSIIGNGKERRETNTIGMMTRFKYADKSSEINLLI